jgi:hypothetical protein
VRRLRLLRFPSLLLATLATAIVALSGCQTGPTYTYSIRSAGPIHTYLPLFADSVASVYADSRGWGHNGVKFKQVSSGGDFVVWLATPDRVAAFSSGCSTGYSCTVGDNVIINEARWNSATYAYHWPLSLSDYRRTVVNHETGHWLGFNHYFCGGPGQVAPIMQQQSISLQGCRANPWPTAAELARLPSLTHH